MSIMPGGPLPFSLVSCILTGVTSLVLSIAVLADIKLCYEVDDLLPFTTGKDEVPESTPGILLELVQEASERSGTTVTFYRRPWKRCIAEAEQGLADGVFPALWSKEREAWARYPSARDNTDILPNKDFRLWTVVYDIFRHKDSPPVWDGKQFVFVKDGIGTPLGYLFEKQLRTEGVYNSMAIESAHAFALLGKKRLDGFIVESLFGQNMTRRLGLAEIVVRNPVSYMVSDWYLVFSHHFYARNKDVAHDLWENVGLSRDELGPVLIDTYSQSDVLLNMQ